MATALALIPAAVFATAGVAKLGRAGAVTEGFARLGLGRWARPLAMVVPPVELAVAVGLVGVPAVAAPLAVVLLIAFTVVLVRAVRSPEPVSCGCFGRGDERPVGRVDVARNVAVAVVCAAVAAGGGPAWPRTADLIVVSTVAVIGLVVWTMSGLVRLPGGLWASPAMPGPHRPSTATRPAVAPHLDGSGA